MTVYWWIIEDRINEKWLYIDMFIQIQYNNNVQ